MKHHSNLEHVGQHETETNLENLDQNVDQQNPMTVLDQMLDISDIRVEYQKPQISQISFGSSCTT